MAAAEGIDCGFHKGGTLVVATNRAQATRSRAEVRESGYWCTGMTWLEAPAAAERLAVRELHGATFNPSCVSFCSLVCRSSKRFRIWSSCSVRAIAPPASSPTALIAASRAATRMGRSASTDCRSRRPGVFGDETLTTR